MFGELMPVGRCCLRELEARNDRPDVLSMVLGSVVALVGMWLLIVLVLA